MQKNKQEVIALIEKLYANDITTEQADKICTQIYESVPFGTAINDLFFFGDQDLTPTQIYEKAQLL